ncbi:hypothetical protein PGTUg99_033367 [Puccinia graminis f. sp. tritici]|uniref:Uncharacterized protein n=1 Tax=Puccinia graminis f. sp. tritici TaxID=56615 RepID=A0A5B0RRK6_PUCGR|nr:hypothetical protein PGTUg99_033367 [Puccinia graminis f. sp. tritici]
MPAGGQPLYCTIAFNSSGGLHVVLATLKAKLYTTHSRPNSHPLRFPHHSRARRLTKFPHSSMQFLKHIIALNLLVFGFCIANEQQDKDNKCTLFCYRPEPESPLQAICGTGNRNRFEAEPHSYTVKPANPTKNLPGGIIGYYNCVGTQTDNSYCCNTPINFPKSNVTTIPHKQFIAQCTATGPMRVTPKQCA